MYLISSAFFQYASMAVNFANQLILTILLPEGAFGTFAKITSIREVMLTLLSVNLPMAIIYYKDNDDKFFYTAFFLLHIQAIVYILIGIPICFLLYNSTILSFNEAFFLILLTVLNSLNVFSVGIYSIYEREQRFSLNSVVLFSSSVISMIISLISAMYYRSEITLIVKEAATIIFSFVYYTYLFRKSIRYLFPPLKNEIDFVIMKRIMAYSMKMYISRLIESVYNKVDILTLSSFGSVRDIGIYDRAKYFLSLPMVLLNALVYRIAFVKYSILEDNKKFFSYNKISILIGILSFVIMALLLSLLTLFFNTKWNNIINIGVFFIGFVFLINIEHFKTFLYAKNLVSIAVNLRIIQLSTFAILIVISYLTFSINLPSIALIYSLSLYTGYLYLNRISKKFTSNPDCELTT